MAEWTLRRKSADYEALQRELNVDQLIIRIMLNRGISTKEEMEKFLYGNRNDIYSYKLLDGVIKAAEIIKDKINNNKKIRVIGDYDVDGVCATAILLKGLRFLGADVDHYIPKRFSDGYGLNQNIIDKASEDGVDTILTCDNGISAFEQVDKANEYDMTVIVTDHHEVPFEENDGNRTYKIPNAAVVVDPKLPDSNYPYKEICGAVVAFKLVECLLSACDTDDISDDLLDELLQYAALATVSDVMTLLDENRIIVKIGMELMDSAPALGIHALLSLNGITQKTTAFHLGFVIGPSINAAGRLDDADKALDLLMTEDYEEAIEKATVLKELNDNRKSITENCTQLAIDKIESTNIKNDKIIVVEVENCHEGVLGIVAGRIKEKYYRPALIVTNHEGILKGSGRSIDEYNLYDGLSGVQDLFIKFGGHAGAAGFSLECDKLDELRIKLNANCSLQEIEMIEKLSLDADMPFSYCDEKIMNQLDKLEPFGNGNPSPKFARNDVTIISGKVFGTEGKVGKYVIKDNLGKKHELTLFKRNAELREYLEDKYGKEETDKLFNGQIVNMPMLIAYYPNWNEYNGEKSIQFVVIDYK